MTDRHLAARLEHLQIILGQDTGLQHATELIGEPEMPAQSPWTELDSGERRHAKGATDFDAGMPSYGGGRQEGSTPVTAESEDDDVAVALDTPLLDVASLRAGEPTSKDVDFCPWNTVLSYPDQFIGKGNRPRARPFFDDILGGRTWQFFYLHDPRAPQKRPHLFVPTAQFEAFLRHINRKLGTALVIPPGAPSRRFYVRFGQGGTPRPRHLVSSQSRGGLNVPWPTASEDDLRAFGRTTEPYKASFLQSFCGTFVVNKSKAANAEARAKKRGQDRQTAVKRAQMYLGLQEGEANRRIVFVCMDLEAIEVSPHPVSEVGIAILDSDDIKGVSPGPSGSAWWRLIKSHHLRTKEYAGMRNQQYVNGCPDNFDFGTSIFAAKSELAATIDSILEPYTSQKRNMVFVAHDTKQDIKLLHKIGVDVSTLPGMVGEVDTAVLHQAWRSSDNSRSLGSVLGDLCMAHQHLHNAGNDAVYTLRAMIGLAKEQPRKDEAELKGEEYVPALWGEPA